MEEAQRKIEEFGSRFANRRNMLSEIARFDSEDRETWTQCARQITDRIRAIRDENESVSEKYTDAQEIRSNETPSKRGMAVLKVKPLDLRKAKALLAPKGNFKVSPLFGAKTGKKRLSQTAQSMETHDFALLQQIETRAPESKVGPSYKAQSFLYSARNNTESRYDIGTHPVKIERLKVRTTSMERPGNVSLRSSKNHFSRLVSTKKIGSFFKGVPHGK